MKKILFVLTGLLFFGIAYGQEESDALRYSYLTPGGTARVQATGGSGVGLGGDAGLMGSNPAAIGLFRTSDFSITPGFRSVTNNGDYLGQSASDAKSNVYLQQLDLIFANNKHKSNSKWQNITFGVGLNRLANFNQNIFYRGSNNTSSYSDNYLITLANGGYTDSQNDVNDIATNNPYDLSPAYAARLIGPRYNAQNQFDGWSSLPGEVLADGKSIMQSNSISTKGGLNEYSIAVAGNYANKFYIGLSLNIPSIKFDRTAVFSEENTEDKASPLIDYSVTNRLHTDGAGINGKLGVIYAVNSMVRIGAAFHSPTAFSLHDTYSTTTTSNTTDLGKITSSTQDFTDGYPGEYEYSLTTPWRAMGGIALIFGTNPDVSQQHGFLSLDYEFVNYAAARFRFNSSDATSSDKAYADALNSSIRQKYQGASNLRLGGELKFNILAIRAGVNWMGSPYSDTQIKGDQMRYSAGLGIRNRGMYADLTYIYSNAHSINQPYVLPDNSLSIASPAPATIAGTGSTILLTIGFKL